MLTQGVKSPTLLLILLFAVLVIDILAMFKLRDMYSDYRKRIPLFANLLIPLGAYLAFTDQQDEMYIWASKIDNLILSGRLGVELHDGNFGESSVSVLVFVVAAIIKTIFTVATENSLYITGVLTAAFTVLISQVFLMKQNVSLVCSHVPALFLLMSFGFVSGVSMSFDVSFTLLYCQILLFIIIDKRRIFAYPTALIFGFAEWIRLEVSVFKVLFLVLIIIEVTRKSLRIQKALKLAVLSLVPSVILLFYKLWAFDQLVPAMVHFKSMQLDHVTLLRSIHYYVVSLGVVFIIFLLMIAFLTLHQILTLRIKPGIYLSRIPELYTKYWFLVGVLILFLSPIYAGPDYYGPSFQRYLLTPLYLALIYLILIIHKTFSISELKISLFKPPLALSINKISLLSIIAILSVSANSMVFGFLFGQGMAFESRPSRATCDQMLGPLISDFWKSKSDKPLVIATSEANGISYASSARLLDMSGVVDSRNYPTNYRPMTPGNMYAKFQFKESIFREKPSIVWPAYSESCSFFDPLSSHQRDLDTQLQAIYGFYFTKHWFPTQSQLISYGYCPHQIQLKQTHSVIAQASFYYLCSDTK